MMPGQPYHLVHIVTDGEYKTPLVASQLFDRAQVQATTPGDNQPLSVSVWMIEPMRDVWDKQSQALIQQLRRRCPNISVQLVGAVGRLGGWPAVPFMKRLRRTKGSAPVVFHCRGEMSLDWATKVKQKADALVLDIRGFWPLERLVAKGIYQLDGLDDADRQLYQSDIAVLKRAVQHANAVTTVSEPLKQYLIANAGARANSYVVPCCVMHTTPDTKREAIRRDLNIADKKAILYLGGTQKYQHLDDLVLPFIQSALKQSGDYVAVFITQTPAKMKELLGAFNIPETRVRVLSVPQNEVAAYLTAMDLGLLLRAPSLLNTFSQPVKLGEYLGAGIPVIVEDGTGNVTQLLAADGVGFGVRLTGRNGSDFDSEVQRALQWHATNVLQRRINARRFVEEKYTWAANASYEREMYITALRDTLNN